MRRVLVALLGSILLATPLLAAGSPTAKPTATLSAAESMQVLLGTLTVRQIGQAALTVTLQNAPDPSKVTGSYELHDLTGDCDIDLSGTITAWVSSKWYIHKTFPASQMVNDCAGQLTATVHLTDSVTGAHLSGDFTAPLLRPVRFSKVNATPEPVKRYGKVTTSAHIVRADWDTDSYRAFHSPSVLLERRTRFGYYSSLGRVTSTSKGNLKASAKESEYSCWRYVHEATAHSAAASSSADCVYASGPKKSVAGPADNFQENAQHDGEAGGPGLPASLHRLWAFRTTAPASVAGYPVIAGGRVFTLVLDDPDTIRFHVDAFDGQTGKLLWSTPIQSSDWTFAALAYASGQVFFEGVGGLMAALNARTGAVDWERIEPYTFGWSPPVAALGMVFAVNFNNGLDAWRQDNNPRGLQATYGGQSLSYLDPYSAVAVTEHGLYLTEGPDVAAAWPFDKDKPGWRVGFESAGEAATGVVHDGQVWSRDSSSYPTGPGKVYSTSDGRKLGTFAGNLEPPVFDGHTAMTIRSAPATSDPGPELIALDTRTFKVKWTRNGVGSGMAVAGHVVYVGADSDTILGISTKAGRTVWRGKVSGYVASATQGVFGMSGINIGDQLLAVPDGAGLVVFGG